MANVRTAFGAILNTVTTVAATSSNTVEQAASAIDMLGAFITKARQEQRDSHIVQAHDYRFKLLAEAAIAKKQLVETINKEVSNTPNGKQLFETYFAEYSALFPTEAQP